MKYQLVTKLPKSFTRLTLKYIFTMLPYSHLQESHVVIYIPISKWGCIFSKEVMTYLLMSSCTSPSSIRLQAAAASCIHAENPGQAVCCDLGGDRERDGWILNYCAQHKHYVFSVAVYFSLEGFSCLQVSTGNSFILSNVTIKNIHLIIFYYYF